MKIFISYSIILLTFFLSFDKALSIPNKELIHSWDGGVLTASGPADGVNNQYLKRFGSSASSVMNICNNSSISYDLASIDYTPIATWAGAKNLNGADVFETGVDGLVLVQQVSGLFVPGFPLDGGKATNLNKDSVVMWQGWVSNKNRTLQGFKFNSSVTILKGSKRIQSGTIIPAQVLYKFTCYDSNKIARETATIKLDDIKINFNVTGCTPDSRTNIVNMDGVPISNIENASADELISTKFQTFTLQCDPNINLKYSIVDLHDITNRSSTSTLTTDSTASGVGYAITMMDGKKLSFGPDGSVIGIKDQKKNTIGVSGNIDGQNNPMQLQLGFSYVRKTDETIKTGSAKSLIGITYSYQ